MNNHTLDTNREERTGFPEVIYGESKHIEDLFSILNHHQNHGKNALITKLQPEKANVLTKTFQNTFFDKASGIFFLEKIDPYSQNSQDDVAILSAGTSDIFIVNEVFYTLQYMGFSATRFSDIGVAGVHRLLDKVEELKRYKILIVVAGFEGALPTVVGGLLPQPILAVPTDVGYGVAKGGEIALGSMLSSCANGIAVLNINNGYGAAMAAIRILNMIATSNK